MKRASYATCRISNANSNRKSAWEREKTASRSIRQLANPRAIQIGNEVEELSAADASLLGKAVLKLALLSDVPAFLLFLIHGLKWYAGAAASLAAALLFGPFLLVIPFGSVALAFRRKRVID